MFVSLGIIHLLESRIQIQLVILNSFLIQKFNIIIAKKFDCYKVLLVNSFDLDFIKQRDLHFSNFFISSLNQSLSAFLIQIQSQYNFIIINKSFLLNINEGICKYLQIAFIYSFMQFGQITIKIYYLNNLNVQIIDTKSKVIIDFFLGQQYNTIRVKNKYVQKIISKQFVVSFIQPQIMLSLVYDQIITRQFVSSGPNQKVKKFLQVTPYHVCEYKNCNFAKFGRSSINSGQYFTQVSQRSFDQRFYMCSVCDFGILNSCCVGLYQISIFFCVVLLNIIFINKWGYTLCRCVSCHWNYIDF
eukprot:TRINITY_DN10237_c0_g3_i3.p1 TRINITY_DN10237_c0_g3~~TRINITY_DN10237_c0_g3_i3.p1  ORF type:complete len:301 (+),score=-14.49 TRINITY_DN10237_c0_g3_i3:1128-2030(+)